MAISLPELPTLSQIAFLLIATIVVCSAVLVVTLRNIFHSLLFLVLTFLGVAGVFLMLAADFLAAVQVLIYVGAIIVLLLFALMLTHRVMSADVTQTSGQWVLAVPVSMGLLTLMFQIFVKHPWGLKEAYTKPTTAIIGTQLLTKYVLPFELASVVLLVAMVGAIVLAKEEKDDPA